MIYVLYHASCYDGFGAAYAAWKSLGSSAQYLPVNYQSGPPDTPNAQHIYIVDFSYPRDVIEKLAERCFVTVLDHHKTAAEELKGLPSPWEGDHRINAVFDMDRSGAMITWHFFHPTDDPPKLLEYIQDRDLWQFRLKGSAEIHAWLRSHPFDFVLWDLLETSLEYSEDPFKEGAAIKRSVDQTVAMMCGKARVVRILNYKAAIVNATCHWSEVGHHLLEKFPGVDFVASYGDVAEGKVIWSLRSKGDFDVSAVAKEFGGGGHKNAAGCNNLKYFVL